MPRRSRDNLGISFPNTSTTSNNQPSLFFGGCELKDRLGEQLEIFEEPIGEEEEETYTMVQNRNGAKKRVEGAFSIRETNGDSRMRNKSPSTLPHFHGLTSKDPDTFLFEFVVIYRTYNYTSNDQRLKLFPSTLKDGAFH